MMLRFVGYMLVEFLKRPRWWFGGWIYDLDTVDRLVYEFMWKEGAMK